MSFNVCHARSITVFTIYHGRFPVFGSVNTLRTKSLRPVSYTSQNRVGQSSGSTGLVPKPGALSLDPTFSSSCQSAT
uniref:Uncharacterized protein n=1 Tax=Arundo donax TaxID=35708 RepID=A0A0A9GGY0_ARUDO